MTRWQEVLGDSDRDAEIKAWVTAGVLAHEGLISEPRSVSPPKEFPDNDPEGLAGSVGPSSQVHR
jgi:hypothetical protein